MEVKNLIKAYKANSFVSLIAEKQKEKKDLYLKNLKGSSDALIASSVYQAVNKPQVFILRDREEAAYFQNDLENLLGRTRDVLFFPTSYKRPYYYDEVENANVLQRAEVLNSINEKNKEGELIVTYPDALTEKVINKRSLVKNTFGIKIGDPLDFEFITELLVDYSFEMMDFVYEPGHFSIRGGIIDIFSFSNDLPYRIELFGKNVESIRTFDPETQLSVEIKNAISVIPDVQTKLLEERRESFLDFIPNQTSIWVKDIKGLLEVVDITFGKVEASFSTILGATGGISLVVNPVELFETKKSLKESLMKHSIIEFGSRNSLKAEEVEFEIKPQPSFNKKFDLFTENLAELQANGYTTLVVGESFQHINKVRGIIEQHDPSVTLDHLPTNIREGFIDEEEKIALFTDHQLFERYFKYKVKERYSRSKALTLKELKSLQAGDYITHIDHGIGRFAGMERKEVNGKPQELVRLIYKDNDVLFLNVHSLHKIAKYGNKDAVPPQMSKLGTPDWEKKKSKVKKKVKEIAIDLIQLYAKRRMTKGTAFSKDTYLQTELETSFMFEDTPDQAKASEEVKADMEKEYPMDRLVCGDVGFGKTEVAMRAAFKAVCDGKQVAIMVPTTVLALQHYHSFSKRLEDMPCKVDYINRFRTAKEIREVKQNLKDGKIDIIIGTHKLVSKEIIFKDLGLLVIDEEQKFGVAIKEKLKDIKVNVDVLTLTATPIPRTLQFSLMGSRDLSIINTPPPNRRPVTTEVHSFTENLVRDAVSFELRRGGQVFFVHNRVKDIEGIANIILRQVPDARIGVAHGQMEGKQLEKVMMRFVNHEYDVLVSTNIIEAGLDISNANTIIINQAQNFGLSDLHQMRGRVGRSNRKAFCYLLTQSVTTLPMDSKKRLQTLEEFSDLGDGFKIAMRDLESRGAGDLLGGEQSGFINDLGADTYQKLLDEAITELKETEFKHLFTTEIDVSKLKVECNIETDLEILIPEDFITNISERLRLYNELDSIATSDNLEAFNKMIQDRFGTIPQEVKELIQTVPLRWEGERLGFEKLVLKDAKMKGYVRVENNDSYFQSEVFGTLLSFIQSNAKYCSLKEMKGKMVITFNGVTHVQQACSILKRVGGVTEEVKVYF